MVEYRHRIRIPVVIAGEVGKVTRNRECYQIRRIVVHASQFCIQIKDTGASFRYNHIGQGGSGAARQRINRYCHIGRASELRSAEVLHTDNLRVGNRV